MDLIQGVTGLTSLYVVELPLLKLEVGLIFGAVVWNPVRANLKNHRNLFAHLFQHRLLLHLLHHLRIHLALPVHVR